MHLQRETNGLALNDVLMSGQTIQEDEFSILVRFRRYQYALMSDEEKMFWQVSVCKRRLGRRPSTNIMEIKSYRAIAHLSSNYSDVWHCASLIPSYKMFSCTRRRVKDTVSRGIQGYTKRLLHGRSHTGSRHWRRVLSTTRGNKQ